MSERAQNQLKQSSPTSFAPVASGVLQRKCGCGNHTMSGGECAECSKNKQILQRASLFPPGREMEGEGEVPPIVHEALRSPGQPLDPATRAFFEPRFGHDFSHVRVHTDARAAESARLLQALAYTLGKDVVFGEKQYAPKTMEGRKLLIHELTHVVQQQPGRASDPESGIGHQQAEWEAERNAQAAETGGSFTATRHLPALMRAPRISCGSGSEDKPIEDAVRLATQWLPEASNQLDRYLKAEETGGEETKWVRLALERNFFLARHPPLSQEEKHEKIRRILKLIQNTRDELGTVLFECIQENDPDCQRGATAASQPRVYKIDICPRNRFLSEDNLAATIIHEMVHILGISKKDLAYSHERIYRFLTLDEAFNNAESYALLVYELGTHSSTSLALIPEDIIAHECADIKEAFGKAFAETERRVRVYSVYGPRGETGKAVNQVYEQLKSKRFIVRCEQQCQAKSAAYVTKSRLGSSTLHICPSWKLLAEDQQVKEFLSALFQEFAKLDSTKAFRYATALSILR